MIKMMSIDAPALQTGTDFLWQDGRKVDMDAFDQLPVAVRNFLNENLSFYPIEDVFYEHQYAHRGDEELTLVWLLEGLDLIADLESKHRASH
jgi:hypothetical protein